MRSPFLILMIFITVSCTPQENELFEFDPRTIDENKITLAEIADDISYIPLDNRYPVSDIHNPKITNNSIFLLSYEGIIAFDRGGKMARKIGNKGRGPGEYLYSTEYTIDKIHETVYIRDRDNIMKVYSRNGDFLRNFSLQEYGGAIDAIESFDSKIFASYFLQFWDAKYYWIILDTTGVVLQKKERTVPIFNSNWGANGGTYVFDNKIFFWNPYIDTIFSIFPDLRNKVSFLFSPGEHRLPKSNFDPSNPPNPLMHLYNIFETSNYWVLRYGYKKMLIALIDKKSKKSYLTYLERDNSGNYLGGISNNLDGGLDFQQKTYFTENGQEYMVGLINPYQLKTYVNSNKFKNSTPKYPDKKKELEKLAETLKETDNPVLMIVKLKK